VAHLLSLLVVQSAMRGQSCIATDEDMVSGVLGEVDFMVEKGRLRGCRRHDRNLDVLST
jgi:hypothetical protein